MHHSIDQFINNALTNFHFFLWLFLFNFVEIDSTSVWALISFVVIILT